MDSYRIVIQCLISHVSLTRSKLFTFESADILYRLSTIDKVSRGIILEFLGIFFEKSCKQCDWLIELKFFTEFCKQTGYPCTEEAFHKGIDPESAPKRKDGTVCLGWRAISAECVYEARAPVIKASISDEGYEILKDFLRDAQPRAYYENPRRRVLCSVSLSLFQISKTIDLNFGDVIDVDRLWKLGGDYDELVLVYSGNDIVHVYKFNPKIQYDEKEYFSKHTVPDVPIGFYSPTQTFKFSHSIRDALCDFYINGQSFVLFEENGVKFAIIRTDFGVGDDEGGDIDETPRAKGYVKFIVKNNLISFTKGKAIQTGIRGGLSHRSHGSDQFFTHPIVQKVRAFGVAYTNMVSLNNDEDPYNNDDDYDDAC